MQPSGKAPAAAAAAAAAPKTKTLLCLDYTTDWYARFRGAKVGEYAIKVEQAEWKDIQVEACSDSRTRVAIKKAEEPLPFSTQKTDREVSPDFVLIRNFPSDIHDNSFRNMVIGLLFNKCASFVFSSAAGIAERAGAGFRRSTRSSRSCGAWTGPWSMPSSWACSAARPAVPRGSTSSP